MSLTCVNAKVEYPISLARTVKCDGCGIEDDAMVVVRSNMGISRQAQLYEKIYGKPMPLTWRAHELENRYGEWQRYHYCGKKECLSNLILSHNEIQEMFDRG